MLRRVRVHVFMHDGIDAPWVDALVKVDGESFAVDINPDSTPWLPAHVLNEVLVKVAGELFVPEELEED